MLYLICIAITSVDLAHYGVSRAKGRVSLDCSTMLMVCLPLASTISISPEAGHLPYAFLKGNIQMAETEGSFM